MQMRKILQATFLFISAFVVHKAEGQAYELKEQQDRWQITPDGAIEWKVDGRLPHHDHIEMSGERISLWMQYGIDTSGRANVTRTMVFPTHRLLPQRTIAHMMYDVKDEQLPRFIINDRLFRQGVF